MAVAKVVYCIVMIESLPRYGKTRAHLRAREDDLISKLTFQKERLTGSCLWASVTNPRVIRENSRTSNITGSDSAWLCTRYSMSGCFHVRRLLLLTKPLNHLKDFNSRKIIFSAEESRPAQLFCRSCVPSIITETARGCLYYKLHTWPGSQRLFP